MVNRILSLFPEDSKPGDICRELGISNSVWTHIVNGRNAVSLNIVNSVHNAFPNVSLNWLIYNEGEKYIDSTQRNSPNYEKAKVSLAIIMEQNKILSAQLETLSKLI